MPNRHLISFLALAISTAAAGESASSIACLSADEQRSLGAKNEATLKQFHANELEQRTVEWQRVMRDVMDAEKRVDECKREGAQTVGGRLGLETCDAEIEEFNALARKANLLESFIDDQQKMIETAVRINRLQYRSCN